LFFFVTSQGKIFISDDPSNKNNDVKEVEKKLKINLKLFLDYGIQLSRYEKVKSIMYTC